MTPATSLTTTIQTTTPAKPRVRRGSRPFIFHIESRTRPGRFYVTDAYHMACTCEAGRARRLCWHVRLAVQAYDWFKRQAASAQRAPAVASQSAPTTPGTGRPAETGMRSLQAAFE